MSKIFSNASILSGLYDFASDPLAGAIGTVNLSVHIPAYSRVYGFWVQEVSPITSAGAATLSFGWITTGVAVPVSTVNNLMVATGIGTFTTFPWRGVNLEAFPIATLGQTFDVTMSIAVAALTAGKLLFDLQIVTGDF